MFISTAFTFKFELTTASVTLLRHSENRAQIFNMQDTVEWNNKENLISYFKITTCLIFNLL